jgi:hypothetical protein
MVVRYGAAGQMIGAACGLAEDQGGELAWRRSRLFGPTVAGMVADFPDAFAEPGAASLMAKQGPTSGAHEVMAPGRCWCRSRTDREQTDLV